MPRDLLPPATASLLRDVLSRAMVDAMADLAESYRLGAEVSTRINIERLEKAHRAAVESVGWSLDLFDVLSGSALEAYRAHLSAD